MLAAVQVVKNSIWVLMGVGRKRGHPGCREPPAQNGRETPTWVGGGGERVAEEERDTHREVRGAEMEREYAQETKAEKYRERRQTRHSRHTRRPRG